MSVTVESKSKVPGLISLILAVALGISASKLLWLILSPPTINPLEINENNQQAVEKQEKTDYGKLIASQHIFGEIKKPVVAKKAPVTVQKKPEVAPTRLNLKLHGIVAYTSKGGFALISSSNGPQKVYSKDETIQEGVTVIKILRDKVVLDNRGKVEELLLPIDQKSNKRNTSTLGANLPGSSTGARVNKGGAFSRKNRKINKPDLASLRVEIEQNPAKLTEIITAAPAEIDGKFVGFRIQPGKNRRLFQQLNFRPNDIITEVNGIVLDDASKSPLVLNELAQASFVSLKVKRGSEEVLIEHSF